MTSRRLGIWLLGGTAVLATVAALHVHHAWPSEAEAATTRPPQLSPEQEGWYRVQLGIGGASPVALQSADPLAEALVRWKRLQGRSDLSFADYAGFLEQHPGWPGEIAMRRAAERALDPTTPPDQVAAYFSRMPPTTNRGQARDALALVQLGRTGEAQAAARAAWTGGVLAPDDEAALSRSFTFSGVEQDQRMEKLLWQHAGAAATRQLPLASPGRRGLYAARLAFQTASPSATQLDTLAGPSAARDAGFLVDKARWLAGSGRRDEGLALLAAAGRLDAPPFDPQAWLGALLELAGTARDTGQMTQAIAVARLATQTYAGGVNVRDRPLAERDPYTSLVWLGAQAALAAGRPADAVSLFRYYAAAAKSPTTQSKGLYWAGRAATAANDQAGQARLFGAAANYYDQFYGQLAAERVGRAIPLPPAPPPLAVTPARRAAFDASELIRAARMLGELGDWSDQSLFLRQIAQTAADDTDHLLIAELSLELARPDLGVMVARAGRQSGASDYVATGFPHIAVPADAEGGWTMVHAIARQESQFDRMAVSRVGARGLMQLMPATAREQAGKLGLPYDPQSLFDPGYNVQLGSAFFARLMDRYGGNVMLAVAAYNAGPGNVNKFIARNGDPRVPGTDVVAWIEAIPLSETRGYVQHVLENAVVYDLLNPERARMPAQNRLSAYLGKSTPG